MSPSSARLSVSVERAKADPTVPLDTTLAPALERFVLGLIQIPELASRTGAYSWLLGGSEFAHAEGAREAIDGLQMNDGDNSNG